MFITGPTGFSLTFANGYTVHVAFATLTESFTVSPSESHSYAEVRIDPASAGASVVRVTPDELAQLLEHVRGLSLGEASKADAIPVNDSTVTKLQQSGCVLQ